MTEDEALAASRQAAVELPLVTSLFADLERAMLEEVMNTSEIQVEKREKLIASARILRTVKSLVLRAAQHSHIEQYRADLAESGLTRP